MTQLARVLATSGPSAEVAVAPPGSCDGCADKGACGMLGTPPASRNQQLTVENGVGAKVGDTVEIDLPPRGELKLSLIVWVVPLVGLLGGAVAGAAVHEPVGVGENTGTLLGAIIGFVASYLVLRRLDRSAASDPKLCPTIVRIVRAEQCARASGAAEGSGD